MIIVKAGPGDTTDSLIRKFTKKVRDDGVLQELKKHEYYMSPSEKRKEEKKERDRKKFSSRRNYSQ